MFEQDGITFLDPTFNHNEIRILKRKLEEILNLKIINATGKHLFIEVRPSIHEPRELVIRQA